MRAWWGSSPRSRAPSPSNPLYLAFRSSRGRAGGGRAARTPPPPPAPAPRRACSLVRRAPSPSLPRRPARARAPFTGRCLLPVRVVGGAVPPRALLNPSDPSLPIPSSTRPHSAQPPPLRTARWRRCSGAAILPDTLASAHTSTPLTPTRSAPATPLHSAPPRPAPRRAAQGGHPGQWRAPPRRQRHGALVRPRRQAAAALVAPGRRRAPRRDRRARPPPSVGARALLAPLRPVPCARARAYVGRCSRASAIRTPLRSAASCGESRCATATTSRSWPPWKAPPLRRWAPSRS